MARYPYIEAVSGTGVRSNEVRSDRAREFVGDVEGIAHLCKDTVNKMMANKRQNTEQTSAYVEMLLGALLDFQERHLGGRLSEGGRERMLEGKWSDKP